MECVVYTLESHTSWLKLFFLVSSFFISSLILFLNAHPPISNPCCVFLLVRLFLCFFPFFSCGVENP
ncbi:hypothetical protein B0T26DRAFT_688745 [Lasiosphaeria miniovina]|uniref:Uncharacterized protein n=1 Tax=Lasiosphaeria miniovina TaxID=1954250 RepID=A0AA40BHV2_9PEZI|nr:uncharacterized protein B0T26DRAFT_688745 [Lasiosphaeria miniovina]KAK0734502.1 hypothetical protein B0T26DRAFT_688745 [Lasiosphaeria miniovina]